LRVRSRTDLVSKTVDFETLSVSYDHPASMALIGTWFAPKVASKLSVS
jgi:hypothetical protein